MVSRPSMTPRSLLETFHYESSANLPRPGVRPPPCSSLVRDVGPRPFLAAAPPPPAKMLSCSVPRNGWPRLFQRPGH
ncbi:hypothetical protein CGRA01v4_00380 [Colletotrichum graminicola]|nr:hypothetical protein CGRA01v4_00380 [Colletotrichum graminicola]